MEQPSKRQHKKVGTIKITLVYSSVTCADPEEGGVGQPPPSPLENHKAIGFHGNTGPDPLEFHKAAKPAFNLGPYLSIT